MLKPCVREISPLFAHRNVMSVRSLLAGSVTVFIRNLSRTHTWTWTACIPLYHISLSHEHTHSRECVLKHTYMHTCNSHTIVYPLRCYRTRSHPTKTEHKCAAQQTQDIAVVCVYLVRLRMPIMVRHADDKSDTLTKFKRKLRVRAVRSRRNLNGEYFQANRISANLKFWNADFNYAVFSMPR